MIQNQKILLTSIVTIIISHLDHYSSLVFLLLSLSPTFNFQKAARGDLFRT